MFWANVVVVSAAAVILAKFILAHLNHVNFSKQRSALIAPTDARSSIRALCSAHLCVAGVSAVSCVLSLWVIQCCRCLCLCLCSRRSCLKRRPQSCRRLRRFQLISNYAALKLRLGSTKLGSVHWAAALITKAQQQKQQQNMINNSFEFSCKCFGIITNTPQYTKQFSLSLSLCLRLSHSWRRFRR